MDVNLIRQFYETGRSGGRKSRSQPDHPAHIVRAGTALAKGGERFRVVALGKFPAVLVEDQPVMGIMWRSEP
jgi:hypothetical protein